MGLYTTFMVRPLGQALCWRWVPWDSSVLSTELPPVSLLNATLCIVHITTVSDGSSCQTSTCMAPHSLGQAKCQHRVALALMFV